VPNRSLFAGIAVALALLVGVAGYLVARYLASQPVDQAEAEALLDMNQANIEDLTLQLEAEIAARPKSEAEERLASPLGQALFRKCSEWMEFYENQPGDEARAYRDEACQEYRNYIDNGAEPAGQPDTT
jgi:hypothetical protein